MKGFSAGPAAPFLPAFANAGASYRPAFQAIGLVYTSEAQRAGTRIALGTFSGPEVLAWDASYGAPGFLRTVITR